MENNAEDRATYINMALDTLSDADNASNIAVLDKNREVVKNTFRGEAGVKLANNIATATQLEHLKVDTEQSEGESKTRDTTLLLQHGGASDARATTLNIVFVL